jgi:hypothetical protein
MLDSNDEYTKILRNVENYSTNNTAQQPQNTRFRTNTAAKTFKLATNYTQHVRTRPGSSDGKMEGSAERRRGVKALAILLPSVELAG